MPGTFTYTESTNLVVVTGGTSGSPADHASFVTADRTVATTACSVGSGAELKAAAAVGASTDLTLTYPVRPVEYKALRLAITTAQNGGAAVSGDETVDIYGTTAAWGVLTGGAASAQKVIPCADTHHYQVGDTVIVIDISAPATYETDTIASISEGVSITLTNNLSNTYVAGDIVGIYQTEQIDVSAAFGTYWSTVAYGQIAKLTFTGFDGTNTGKIDQPIWGVIWNLGDDQYKIKCEFEIGDGSTATYFTSKFEQITYPFGEFMPRVNGNATWQIGLLDGDWGHSGCSLHVSPDFATTPPLRMNEGGTFLLYASQILSTPTGAAAATNRVEFHSGTTTIKNSQLQSNTTDTNNNGSSRFAHTGGTQSIEDLYVCQNEVWTWTIGSVLMNDVRVHSCRRGLSGGYNPTDILLQDVKISSSGTRDINAAGNASNHEDLVLQNSVFDPANMSIAYADQAVREEYTVDVHVVDRDGNDISGVVVDCEDTFGNSVWSAGTVTTDANGDITQQVLVRRRWVGLSETLTTFTPHKFTIHKAGYDPVILEGLVTSSAIVWEVVLTGAVGPFSNKQWR